MKISCCMTAGHGDNHSQDRLLVFDSVMANGEAQFHWSSAMEGIIAIFDGVGGVQGGAYASDYTAKQMSAFPANEDAPALRDYLSSIAAHLRECNNCATTATGLVISEQRKLLFHIGNTRLFFYDGSFMNQATEDQTYVNEHIGELSEEEYDRVKNQITGCLGGNREQLFEKLIVRDVTELLSEKSLLVLTCDGIHEYVDSYSILEAIQTGKPLRDLIRTAREAGSDDDCSIMVVNYNE